MAKSFPRGIHFDAKKTLTSGLDIEIMPAPSRVYIPMVQHSGSPAIPVVKNGESVVIGQLIGSADKNGCNVYSSVCGTVKGTEEKMTPKGKCIHVVIENNFKNDNVHLAPLNDITPEKIINRVRDCGIAGMGGAGFPTAIKLDPKDKVDTLIINGAECEPYRTCDHRVMLEYTQKFIDGCILAKTALGASKIIIGIEDNKPDAIKKLNDYISSNNILDITTSALKSKYPQGADKQLIYSLTGKKIAKGIRSAKYGFTVFNVHTVLSIYLAVKEGKQCYSRIMTVTGKGIKNPKNIWVSSGALFEDIIEFCGGINQDTPPVKMVDGGPMMGKTVYSTDVAATKIMDCLLLLSNDEAFTAKPSQCINCGKCAKACPMHLMPMYIDAMALGGFIKDTERYGISYCIECGCCTYVCPARRTLVQSIVLAKKKLKEIKNAEAKKESAK